MKPEKDVRYIFLARHGATRANEEGICQGIRLDQSLSPNGEIQAEKLGSFLRSYCLVKDIGPPLYFISSPLRRAQETKCIVQKAFHDTRYASISTIHNGFQEIDHGEWDGRTWGEIQAHYPDLYETWENDIGALQFPNGESVRQARHRIISLFKQLMTWRPRTSNILIVAHGGTNHIILSYVLKTNNLMGFRQDNAALNVIEYHPQQKSFRVALLNSTAHLL